MLFRSVDVHRRLAEESPVWLAPDGRLVVEIGASQGSEVAEMLAPAFGDLEVLPDLSGRDRVVRGRRRG